MITLVVEQCGKTNLELSDISPKNSQISDDPNGIARKYQLRYVLIIIPSSIFSPPCESASDIFETPSDTERMNFEMRPDVTDTKLFA